MAYRKPRVKTVPSLSVPIVRFHAGRYAVDRQVLDHIFFDQTIARMKVVIISMCGTMHCGKSLALNYFYDHLLKTKTGNGYRSNDIPSRCFSWGNGIKTQKKTFGIHITKKPIVINRQGEQLAVFLVDSEGMNLKSGPEQQFIFNLVTLLSSVQIINVEKDIQDRDIIPLKPFLQAFDELRGESFREKFLESRLLFLVRDRANTPTFKLGRDERCQYLSKSFKKGTTLEKIKGMFSDLHCFLMPHPGSKAVVKQVGSEFRGTYGELNESFTLHLRDLFDLVLSRDNLSIKRVNGKALSCAELLEHIKLCEDIFLQQDPAVALVKLAAHSTYEPIIKKLIGQFKDSVNAAKHKKALDEDNFSTLWLDEMNRITEEFDNQSPDFPVKAERNEYRTNLMECLTDYEDEARALNEKFYNDCRCRNKKALENGMKTYMGEFQAMASGNMDCQAIQEFHEMCRSRAVRTFERAFKPGGNEFVKEYKEKLLQNIQEKLDEKLATTQTSQDTVVASATIGWEGGVLENQACLLQFVKGTLPSGYQLSLNLEREDDDWPLDDYLRHGPVIVITGGPDRISKHAICTIHCWSTSFGPDANPDQVVHVLQKRGQTWRSIHNEVLDRKTQISCKLSELGPITLASVTEHPTIYTLLYFDAQGNFRAFFFEMTHLEKVRASEKNGRCVGMSELNALILRTRDEIHVSLSKDSSAPDTEVESCQFVAQDITGLKSITFCGPDVAMEESRTNLRYEVKVNGETKVLDRFKANLNCPGRPDTASNGPVVINQTHATGEYLTMSSNIH